MFVIYHRKIFFIISGVLLALSVWAMFTYGFKTSIDFNGGTLTEVKFVEPARTTGGVQSGGRPEQTEVEQKISTLNLGGFSVRPSGALNYTIRTRELTTDERSALIEAIGNPVIERQNTIGPIAGAELQSKAIKAVIVVILMIVLFITFAFRKVSASSPRQGGVKSWKYGLATIVALMHDVIIPTGVFVVLGHFWGIEIDLLFVTGLLAILGYSVHDTIVVFDRVRENLRINKETNTDEDFEALVGKSVTQTIGRSINTSLTIFITLLVLYLVGSTATKDFALLLIIGVIAGTYSSIFVASPLLVTFYKWQRR
ncbi:MAG: protein translocase subunit SecF [bacterium]|nr:protein translocase subunit SecF [bacterium]